MEHNSFACTMNILDLNDDCLDHILSELSIEDYNNFAQVCTRFRNVFIARAGKRNRQFSIDESCKRRQLIEFCICRESVETLIIDLDHFNTARIFRSHGCETPLVCFTVLCCALEGMVSLRRLVVKQMINLTTSIAKPIEQILAAVRNLKELTILELHVKDGEFNGSNILFRYIIILSTLQIGPLKTCGCQFIWRNCICMFRKYTLQLWSNAVKQIVIYGFCISATTVFRVT